MLAAEVGATPSGVVEGAMGCLRHPPSGALQPLDVTTTVGRAPGCALLLDASFVSAEHASVRWNGDRWVLRDLGSRNGTWLDGAAITVGDPHPLRAGSELSFGAPDHTWVLEDASPPTPWASSRGRLVRGSLDLLALPDAEAPEQVAYRLADGSWAIEHAGAVTPVRHLDRVTVHGVEYTLHLPVHVAPTTDAPQAAHTASDLALTFRVSRDEEHVEVEGRLGQRVLDLGSRSHHYLLLVLARRRLGERHDGEDDEAAGWVHALELCDMLKVDDSAVNLQVFRARKQLAKHGVPGAARLVERRPDSRELRIGVGELEVHRL